MNELKIPQSFQLMGHNFKVEWDNKLFFYGNQDLGLCDFNCNRIVIQPNTDSVPRERSQIEHTYLHEMVHAILSTMGEQGLSDNEVFVDTFAGLLHQALQTSKYDDSKKKNKQRYY